MAATLHPGVLALAERARDGFLFGQIWVCAVADGFELRHVDDHGRDGGSLRPLDCAAARQWAQVNAAGGFRPLRSAPDLRPGWRCVVGTPAALGEVVERFYPGAIADWWTARGAAAAATPFRTFAARQSGMYRVVRTLDDAGVESAIGAVCDRRFCLKRRLWGAGDFAPEAESEKSIIPCLEPCALFLEFSRRVARMAQEARVDLELAASEVGTLEEALKHASEAPVAGARAADFSSPLNARRVEWVLRKLRRAASTFKPAAPEGAVKD